MPLHDGAVVVSEERLLRAGVVLPLSTESDDTGHGTRHRAARGLAHATDALVVCVSEEHGTVSLAQDDLVDPMANEAELGKALRHLWTENDCHESQGATLPRFRPGRILPHLAIFGCVVASWAALALDRSHMVTRVLPLEIRGIAEGLTFDPPRYTSIALELRSSRREIDLLPPNAIDAYVDLSTATLGLRTFRVNAHAPAGIEVTNSTPSSVDLRIRLRTTPGTALQPSPQEALAAPDQQEHPKSAQHR
jgi:hypothetical protein